MLKPRLWLYFIFFLLFFWLPNLIGMTFFKSQDIAAASSLGQDDSMLMIKNRFFMENESHFNCVFIGDSRTYQNIDPQIVDHFLKTKSYNLGGAAHWFETQYAQLSDLLPGLPPGTTVVWSIGHNNFESPYRYIPNSYPLHLRDAWRYFRYGFSWNEMKSNILKFHFLDPYADKVPGGYIYNRRSRIYQAFKNFMDRPMFSKEAPPPSARVRIKAMENAAEFKKIYVSMKKNRAIRRIDIISDEDKITGALLFKYSGVLLLVETDTGYYRRQKMSAARLPVLEEEYSPGERYVRLFDAMLDLFEKYKVRLVVNELEYAPFAYTSPENREKYRAFMKKIEQRVEARHIPYLRVPNQWFSDNDFYDVDHLNFGGAEKYSAFLAARLKEVI